MGGSRLRSGGLSFLGRLHGNLQGGGGLGKGLLDFRGESRGRSIHRCPDILFGLLKLFGVGIWGFCDCPLGVGGGARGTCDLVLRTRGFFLRGGRFGGALGGLGESVESFL